jgi:hypothetical protein
MKRIPCRKVIYSRDLANFTGKGIRTCDRMLEKVRKAKNKHARDLVTVKEFCQVMKFDLEELQEYLH